MLLLLSVGGTMEVYAQSWLENLGKKAAKRAEERAKSKVEEKVNKTVDKAVDKPFETAEDAVKGDGKNKDSKAADASADPNAAGQDTTQAEGQQQPGQTLEMTYAKSDFVPGDEIIFEDNMDSEQLGEFPSQWELYAGVAEVIQVNGKKAIMISERSSRIGPLMREPQNYLGDKFTVEFDYMVPVNENGYDATWLYVEFNPANDYDGDELMQFHRALTPDDGRMEWNWKSTAGTGRGDFETPGSANEWAHVSMSFNKRAWKVYLNGIRVVNVPNVSTPPGMLHLSLGNGGTPTYITNFRIAKGAVPLYDRMMSEGKFITYGITFDVGKSTIKPESMGEINRIVQLMNENPDLKFSVEGHTDATGNAASNQTLSEARSKAIVDKLVELGIAADRLASFGKGQNNPIADNSTDEGRAKNRRVEFVKQ